MKLLLGIRIGWGFALCTSALWFGCGGGLGPSAGGTGAGSGPLAAGGGGEAGSGASGHASGAAGNPGVAGQGTAGIGGTCPAGTEGCLCYGNDTCNSGLTCASRLCVNLAGTGGAGTGGTATGGRATGGVATGGTSTGGTPTGGRATGGVATGGVVSTGGGPTVNACGVNGPCNGQSCPICTVFATTSYISGNLGSGASCYETTAAINSGLCGNFVAPRALTINGTDMNCVNGGSWPSLPAKVNGGYCFVISAGQQDYAYFSTY
jgi:hypothetical protein